MSTKSTLISAGIILLVFAVIFYFYGEHKYDTGYDDAVATLTQDSTAVDTVLTVEYDTVYIYFPYYAEAVIDTVNEAIRYSTQIDTSVVIDSVEVAHITQDIYFSEGMFEILSKIDIYPIEKIIEVTKTQFRTVVKEVTVSEFPNTWLTGFISGVISFLIMVLLL